MHVFQCMLVQYAITQQPVVYVKNKQVNYYFLFVSLFVFLSYYEWHR